MTIADQARQTAEELRRFVDRNTGFSADEYETMLRAASQLEILAGAYTTAAAHQCECGEGEGMKRAPLGFEDVGTVMSNFDHEVEPWAEEKLKSGDFRGDYPAWEFHGTVWWEESNFHCQVMRYGSHIDTVSAPTLQGIMDEASGKYGYE